MSAEAPPWEAAPPTVLGWPTAAELRAMPDAELRGRVRKLGWQALDPRTHEECVHRGWLVRLAPGRPITTHSDELRS